MGAGMEDGRTIMIRVRSLSIEARDSQRYRLHKKFFYLYTYLALKRLEDTSEDGGFVGIDEIVGYPLKAGHLMTSMA